MYFYILYSYIQYQLLFLFHEWYLGLFDWHRGPISLRAKLAPLPWVQAYRVHLSQFKDEAQYSLWVHALGYLTSLTDTRCSQLEHQSIILLIRHSKLILYLIAKNIFQSQS